MTLKRDDRWLLPDGIEEILPDEARALERLRREALDLFKTRGYELVMPPLLEHLESLLSGSGSDLDHETFKLTDPMTGRLVGIRADMTPQAARIDAHYLKRQGVARLCYVGPVLRTVPETAGGLRELLQIGAEIYGDAGPGSDMESCGLMLDMLDCAGLGSARPECAREGGPGLTLDIGHVGIFRALMGEAALSAPLEQDLFDAFGRKAIPEMTALLAVADLDGEYRARLLALPTLCGDAGVLSRARVVLAGSAGALQAITEIESLIGAIKKDYPGLSVFVDLSELRGYRYYTGAIFSAWLPGESQPLAQGGRYDGIGAAFGRARPATGFGADLRHLNRVAERVRAAVTTPPHP